jgi:hypothetical protein
MTDPTTERRRHPRLEFRTEIHYRPTALHDATARELSVAGITFVTDESLLPGTELDLYLINRNVQFRGIVTHQLAAPDGQFRTGVHFLREEPQLVDVLATAYRVQRRL